MNPFFKKDSPDQKSGFAFAERNAKSVLRSKIRFWIHRKEHTQMSMTNVGRRNNNGFLDTEEELYTRYISRSNDFCYRTFVPYSNQRMSKLDVSFLMQPPLVAYKRDVSCSVPLMTRLLSSLVHAPVRVLDAIPAIASVLSLIRGTKLFFHP